MEKPKTKIELNYSRAADKFFKEHPEIKEKFKEKLKNFYVNFEKNVDIKIIKGIKLKIVTIVVDKKLRN